MRKRLKEKTTTCDKIIRYLLRVIPVCTLTVLLLNGCSFGGSQNTGSGQETGKSETAKEDVDTASGFDEGVGEEKDLEEDGASQRVLFEAQDLSGNVVSSDIFSDAKLTMVNVWATYCNPCLNEMPELGELAGEYDSGEFRIIGIVSDVQEGAGEDGVELARALVEETGADYPHLLLNESLYYSLLTGVSAVPTTFFIDEDGKVLDTVIGARDKEGWKERIDELLEGK